MPEDYYGEDYGIGYEAPLSYIEQMYDLPAATTDEGALPAAAPTVDLGGWSLENFQKQFMQGDPSKADAAAKWLADQAAQGKEYVYDPNAKDLAYQMQMNSAVPLMSGFGGPSYANFDPNNPTASMGEVFRFDIDKNKGTAPVVLGEGQNYVLTDAKGDKVLGRASTAEEMRALMDAANAQKYGWNLYQGNEQGGYTKGAELFGESDPRVGGVLGALINVGLPLAMSFVPGVGWVGSAALAGAGSTAAGLMTGKTLGDALKSGAITAGTAGLLKGTGLDQTIGNALSDVPVVGDTLRSVGNAFAPNTAGNVASNFADEIVVTGLRGAGAPLVTGGLAAALAPTLVTNPFTGDMVLSKPTQPKFEEPVGPLDEIVVTGAPSTASVTTGALSGLANTFVPTVTTNPITGDLEIKRPEPTQQQEQVGPADEIVVTGNTTPIDVGGALSNLISTNAPSLGTKLEDLAVKPAEQPQQTSQEQTGSEGEIVVTGTGTAPGAVSGLGGALTNVPSTTPTTGPEPRRPDYGDKVEEQPQDQTGGEIVVTGTGTAPGAVSGLGAAITNAAAASEAAAKAEKKGGLDTMDKIRLGLLGAGLVSDLIGGGGGSGGGATLPFGMGARNPIYSAKLPTPGVNGAFAVGGLGGSTLPMTGDLTKFGMGNIPRAAPTQVPQYGGVNPPGFNTQTWDWLGPQNTVAKNIIDQLAVLPSSAAPVEPVKKAMGGYAVGGPGDGRSDEIPALLSDGEYVIDAETVALLGNGSNKAGAQQLDKFRANIRKHKGRELAKGKFSVKAKQPDAYLSGGR